MRIRSAAVAGQFYPSSKQEIKEELEKLVEQEKAKINYSLAQKTIIGGIVPHAAYAFSGAQAIHFFELIKKSQTEIDTVIILAPNHAKYGQSVALDENDRWETPVGKYTIDVEMSMLLGLPLSPIAHRYDHAVEVMLPMLHDALGTKVQILPISFRDHSLSIAKKIAEKIWTVSQQLNRQCLIIASSNFSHNLSPSEGYEEDNKLLNEISRMDSQAAEREVNANNISTCGVGAILCLMEYAKLQAEYPKAELLARGHSGDRLGAEKVVNYVSMLFYT